MIVSLGQFLVHLGKLVIIMEILITWLLTVGSKLRRRLKLMSQMLGARQLIISLKILVFIVVANGIPFMFVLMIINCITIIMMPCQSSIELLILLMLMQMSRKT